MSRRDPDRFEWEHGDCEGGWLAVVALLVLLAGMAGCVGDMVAGSQTSAMGPETSAPPVVTDAPATTDPYWHDHIVIEGALP